MIVVAQFCAQREIRHAKQRHRRAHQQRSADQPGQDPGDGPALGRRHVRPEADAHDQPTHQHRGVPATEAPGCAVREVSDVGIDEGIPQQTDGRRDPHPGTGQPHHRGIEVQRKGPEQRRFHDQADVPHPVGDLDRCVQRRSGRLHGKGFTRYVGHGADILSPPTCPGNAEAPRAIREPAPMPGRSACRPFPSRGPPA